MVFLWVTAIEALQLFYLYRMEDQTRIFGLRAIMEAVNNEQPIDKAVEKAWAVLSRLMEKIK